RALLASMEPPLIAAEDVEQGAALGRLRRASMEPPLIAAEDVVGEDDGSAEDPASMEPPLIAAEDVSRRNREISRPCETVCERSGQRPLTVDGGCSTWVAEAKNR